jgi:asparagine synthase (glutamine-hydrolysing)
MCGIWIYLSKKNTYNNMYNDFMKIGHRGPDKSIFINLKQHNLYIGFHRLAIMGCNVLGDQPFLFETHDKIYYLVCNGEIYNYKDLASSYGIELTTGSDCEILLKLFLLIGLDELCAELNAEYAFCICEIDKASNVVTLHISRDHCGIRPLFISNVDDEIVLSSELKGIPEHLLWNAKQFKPRCSCVVKQTDDFVNIHNKYDEYINFSGIKTTIYDLEEAKKLINTTFRLAVESRLMSDEDIELGFALSGGLDSSLVASIAASYYHKLGKQINTFSIGMEGGTDEKYAKMVAEHIGSNHTHIMLEEKDFLNAIPNVVYATETYCLTTVRASTGQYLLAKWISENTKIKVVGIGDLSDELCSGYFYNFLAPCPEELHLETVRILDDIHYYDVLRADRGISHFGLEARCPFSDINFIKLYLSIDPVLRMPTYKNLEKWLLRVSFENDNILPKEVLFRNKEAFSDAITSVSRSWFEIIQENVEKTISDEEFIIKKSKYTHLQPKTKEALYFRELFSSHYGLDNSGKIIPYYWLPKWINTNEPSARTLDIYKIKNSDLFTK